MPPNKLIRLEADNGAWCFENGNRIAWEIIPDIRVTDRNWRSKRLPWKPYEAEKAYHAHTSIVYAEGKGKK